LRASLQQAGSPAKRKRKFLPLRKPSLPHPFPHLSQPLPLLPPPLKSPQPLLPPPSKEVQESGSRRVFPERKTLRILIAKPGLDGHDRGAKVVARALRDAGFEVVYTGLHQTPLSIVNAAIQEDVDAIGLSILSGAHMTYFPKVLELLKEKGAEDIVLFGGGIIPEEDRIALEKMGVKKIFPPGTPLEEIISWVETHIQPKSGRK
jgi:methylmalonyl-CoA mutase C-terminal domain/subunit